MSIPSSIRTAIQTRLSAVAKTVIRGKREFDASELPAISIYMAPRTVEEKRGERFLMEGNVIVEYHKATVSGTEPDDQADAMIAAIRAAIEIAPRTLGDLVVRPGIDFIGDDIQYPETGGGVVSVQVSYTAPHVESFG